ncbi:hypothetical protein HAX54_010366 [Datura stramonium]|uniref:Uncharacterized protein n=1 Tax=Datura stramonium TaxID=4076 RepID=A0ABS8THY1_DATST|nr:hypothetical protein [Datura stramonium]
MARSPQMDEPNPPQNFPPFQPSHHIAPHPHPEFELTFLSMTTLISFGCIIKINFSFTPCHMSTRRWGFLRNVFLGSFIMGVLQMLKPLLQSQFITSIRLSPVEDNEVTEMKGRRGQRRFPSNGSRDFKGGFNGFFKELRFEKVDGMGPTSREVKEMGMINIEESVVWFYEVMGAEKGG